jgi:hypothetical protein
MSISQSVNTVAQSGKGALLNFFFSFAAVLWRTPECDGWQVRRVAGSISEFGWRVANIFRVLGFYGRLPLKETAQLGDTCALDTDGSHARSTVPHITSFSWRKSHQRKPSSSRPFGPAGHSYCYLSLLPMIYMSASCRRLPFQRSLC